MTVKFLSAQRRISQAGGESSLQLEVSATTGTAAQAVVMCLSKTSRATLQLTELNNVISVNVNVTNA